MSQEVLDINILDAHERMKQLEEDNSEGISDMVYKIRQQKMFGDVPYYIFAHKRTESGSPDRILWQPRLTKPKAQTNSMLFRVDPDIKEGVTIIWIIPPRELWPNYEKGKLMHNETVLESIDAFQNNRRRLEAPEKGDLPEDRVKAIYRELIQASSEAPKPYQPVL